MNMPLSVLNRRRRIGAASAIAFSPSTLFALAEPGVWYDPSDLTTLFTDTAGTTPVTTPGQTVALMLDKSKGLVLGTELVTNGTFTSPADWTLGTGASIAGGVLAYAGGTSGTTSQSTVNQSGKTYVVTFTIVSRSAGSVRVRFGGNSDGTLQSAPGTFTLYTKSLSNNSDILVETNSAFVGTIDNISVRELPGFHATQATAASRPTYGVVPLGGRRNLLTFSEDPTSASWVKSNATVPPTQYLAPNGTLTADKLTESAITGIHLIYNGSSLAVASAVTFTVYAKAAERSWLALDAYIGNDQFCYFDLASGALGTMGPGCTGAITSVGDGWYRCTVTRTATAGTYNTLIILCTATGNNASNYAGDGTSGILIWGAQMELGSTATAYQRVTTAFDVTEAGVQSLAYLNFEVSDFMVTPTITPGTDKVQIFAGVRKLADVDSIIAEASNNSGANFGAIMLRSSISGNTGYFWRSAGSALGEASVATGYAAPITNVLTGLGDISGDRATLRINGTQVAQSTADQGTGNFLAYPLYIGMRAGTSLPFNGNVFSLLVRFGANLDATAIANTETWVNGKTGAYA